MACYSGGAKGLVLDYASDEGAEMAPFTPETRAKLPGMIDPGLAGGKSAGRRSDGRRAGRQVRRNLQGRLRRSDRRSRHRAGPDADQSRAIPYNPEPLRSVLASTDKPVLAFGRIAQNASEISRKYQSETGVPFIHGLSETVRALQGAGPLCGGAAARRQRDRRSRADAPRVWTARRSMRCSRRTD